MSINANANQKYIKAFLQLRAARFDYGNVLLAERIQPLKCSCTYKDGNAHTHDLILLALVIQQQSDVATLNCN